MAAGAVLSSCVVPSQEGSAPAGGGSGGNGGAADAPGGGSAGDAGAAPLVDGGDVPAGGGVVLADRSIVVTRDSEGAVHGFSAVCTHQGCLVGSVADGTINCPCHGSKFDAASGAPVAGPAQAPLGAVPVEERDGAVYEA